MSKVVPFREEKTIINAQSTYNLRLWREGQETFIGRNPAHPYSVQEADLNTLDPSVYL